MKKFTLLLAAFAVSLSSFAQTNLSLDNWTDAKNAENWFALVNDFDFLVGDTSVVRTAGVEGTFGAKLKPVDLTALGLAGLYLSLFQLGPEGEGDAYTSLLDSVYFSNELVDATGGAAAVEFLLTRANSTTGNIDTLATATYDASTPTTGYEKVGLEFVNGPQFEFGVEPDSIKISASFVSTDAASVGASYYSIDGIELVIDPASSVQDVIAENVAVFPTVSNTVINFNFDNNAVRTISLVDVTGKTVKTINVNATNNTVDVSTLVEGAYFYQVTNANAQLVKAGKVIVSK